VIDCLFICILSRVPNWHHAKIDWGRELYPYFKLLPYAQPS
jgi:hypothetical protein